MRTIYFFGSKDIKDLIKRALQLVDFRAKHVLDFPAGSGDMSQWLYDRGAYVSAYDVFPEFFKALPTKCQFADLQNVFPMTDESFDLAICQEGVEHVPNQMFLFQQFNRVTKSQGRFFLTTPNYSNLRSRFSYFLFEAETPKMLPPNEIESIWHGKDDRLYLGHIFSVGVMKLRCLAALTGFELVRVHPSRINWSAAVIGILALPFLLLLGLRNYSRSMRKTKKVPADVKAKVFNQILSLNFHPSVLFGGHLILEFKKVSHYQDVKPWLREQEITTT